MPIATDIRVYEAMFLVDPGDAGVWDELSKHLENILTRNGAEVLGVARWDERKLAYPIAQHKRGTYVLAFFRMPSGTGVAEIENDCRLSEKILRTLILKADQFTVKDMRHQLGEDLREEPARRLIEDRGEQEPVAAGVGDAAAPATGAEPGTPGA